jgi:7-cyano-7-deazaguanine reductase
MEIPEFTCLCPMTGQPDFAVLSLEYVPDRLCVELKSLKLYVWSFRDQGAFHEAVTNRILEDLVKATQAALHALTAKFNVRGGILHLGGRRHRNALKPSPAKAGKRLNPRCSALQTYPFDKAAHAARGRDAESGACAHRPCRSASPSTRRPRW